MKVKAKKSFSGPLISMSAGSTADITDKVILQDLLRAEFIEVIEVEEVPKNEGKRVNKKRSR